MTGRVAIVTGGGTGLGREIAREFARRGANLVLASRDPRHLAPAAAEFEAAGTPCLAVPTDVRDHRATRRLIRATLERFGRLDVVVNNAAGNFVRPAARLPEPAFANVVDIVLNGTFNLCRAAHEPLAASGNGVILNIVATYAWTGGPGTIHSAAAKAGVLALTRTLAVEWARDRIRVVAVAPGPFESAGAADRLWPSDELRETIRKRIPMQRFARREEVARACAWIAGDEAAYVTGECLTLDGGAWLGRGILGDAAGDEPGAVPLVRRRRRRPGEPEIEDGPSPPGRKG